LIDFVSRLGFRDSFAFGAPKVIGHFVAIWLISYADKIIVTGMSSRSSISSLLYTSDLGRHTSILFLHREKGKAALSVARYAWEHRRQRPNTHTFPLSCPECHSIRSWNRAQDTGGKPFTLRCRAKVDVDGEEVTCAGSYEVIPRPSATLVESPFVGQWYSYDAGEA
jgi:hypothetical protein